MLQWHKLWLSVTPPLRAAFRQYPVPTKAETQGATDRTVAEWLKRRGRRDDVILATKVRPKTEGGSDRRSAHRTAQNRVGQTLACQQNRSGQH